MHEEDYRDEPDTGVEPLDGADEQAGVEMLDTDEEAAGEEREEECEDEEAPGGGA